MLLFTLTFLLGDVLLQQFSHLPNLFWISGFIVFFIFIFYFNKKIALGMLLGFFWTFFYAEMHLAEKLPNELEGKKMIVRGYIAAIPNISKNSAAFLFSLNQIQNHTSHGLIRLSWRYTDRQLRVGDQWQLAVKLKKIHGLMNPSGFDYEAWAFQEGIIANGYIVNDSINQLISHRGFMYPINRFRQMLNEKIISQLPKTETSSWITALAIGERQGISQDKWEVLRSTGTNHLMAIAGLHIGFMSSFIFALVSFVWRRISYLVIRIPAQHAGAIAALGMALLYSMLAGFSIPTQRACIMLTVFLIILLLRRKIISWQTWSVALLMVLLINPLSVLTESFWLSFGSVALIIYGVSARLNPKGIWWKWGRIQWVIAFGLIPLSVWLFHQCSFTSFIANSIAIPWVGFIIVPLTLLGCFCLFFSAKMSGFFLILADKNLAILWKILTYFSHISWGVWYPSVTHHWIIVSAIIGVVILLFPMGLPGRGFGLIWLLPLLLSKPLLPKNGEAWFTLLDVGQGLSAVVQTKNHVLIFDAGAKLGDNYDMGRSVVIPFLQINGIKKIDMLVISHGDNDHMGGANAILQQMDVSEIVTSVPELFPEKEVEYCLKDRSWRWDGVVFQFLYPPAENLSLGNNSSCVLKITTQNQSLLLTGDIEKLAEKFLVQHSPDQLKADILIAPHHGSKTSGLDEFIQRVHPSYVLFPVGYRNRYHFPNVTVVEKYQNINAKEYDSVHAGAIKFMLSPTRLTLSPELYRIAHARYWNY